MATTIHQVVPILCRVVRTLRYVPFKHLIGKVVMVPGPASVAGAVQRELGLRAAFGDLISTQEEDRTGLAIAR